MDGQRSVTVILDEGEDVVILAPSVGIAVTTQDFLKEIKRYERNRLVLLKEDPGTKVWMHLEHEDVVNLKKILRSID